MLGYGVPFERLIVGLTGSLARLRLCPLGELDLDLLTAIKETLDRPRPGRLLIENIEDRLHRAYDDVERNSTLLPALYQRPVERTEEQMLVPPTNERVLDLGEIVEVIQGITSVAEGVDEVKTATRVC